MIKHFAFCLLALGTLLFFTACGTNPPPATTDANQGPSSTATTAVLPTETAPAATAVVDASDTTPACNPTQPLNLRAGPGTSFEPPLRELAPEETLTPLAFSAQGFPGGQWLEVTVAATGEQGWVSAGAAFVTCNVAPASLPPAANIPATPTTPPTATPAVVAQAGPPRITNDAPGGTKAEYVIDEVVVDDEFLFQMRIADTRFGEFDGAGIDYETFTIATVDQNEVIYENREDHAAYCVFQGGEPDCNPWPQENGRFYWPNGIEVAPGSYHATILVFPQDPAFDGEVWNWDFDFWIELP